MTHIITWSKTGWVVTYTGMNDDGMMVQGAMADRKVLVTMEQAGLTDNPHYRTTEMLSDDDAAAILKAAPGGRVIRRGHLVR